MEHPGDPVTIVVCDGQEMVRAGLRLVLEREPGLLVVGDVATPQAAARAVHALGPDVLVLDLGLPGPTRLPAVAGLRDTHPGTALVLLSLHRDPELAREALGLGVSAFVLKTAGPAELISAIQLAAAGGTYLSPELRVRLTAQRGRRTGPDALSRRELEVLRLIAHGHTNSEIAAHLYLSVRTVESHRARIQHKLKRSGRSELVAHARALGLL